MQGVEIQPFSDGHLGAAATLLAERHRRQRVDEPLLPDDVDFRAEVEALWAKDGSGAVALRDGRVVAYVIGTRLDDDVWGPNAWVEPAGHAVEEPEGVRDLYAAAAERWFEEGRTRHYAVVPAGDGALVDAWFRLGFGHQSAYALQEVPAHTDVRLPTGFEIRRPTAEDVEALIDVDLVMPRHQRASPIFSGRPLPTVEEVREEWARTLADDAEEVLVGYRDGKPVACWSLVSAEQSGHFRGLAQPKHACYLSFAATLPESRGSGIGVALTEASFAWAAEQGYEVMVTDWRVTNLLASRFWPRRGFRTVFLRLYRAIQ